MARQAKGPQVIPAAAVEAAADALREAFDMGVGGFEEQARAALEAAAPYMLASIADSRDGDLFRFTWAQREWLRGGGE